MFARRKPGGSIIRSTFFPKTFLGLTVACARCHDHKFDAISTKDYYALAGYLQSSRHQLAFVDPPDRIGAHVKGLEAIKAEIAKVLKAARPEGPKVAAYLLAARDALHAGNPSPGQIAESRGLDEATLARWIKALQEDTVRLPSHPSTPGPSPATGPRASPRAIRRSSKTSTSRPSRVGR